MGEVYLADDLSLNRKVALKFLPDAFTGDTERMARFEREARLLASLNHPNISGIYGLEQSDGIRFLVLEYVKGETLQARLRKGALPLEEVLSVCLQIAEGLEAAHEKGIIHRDLKPSNVMITAETKAKILDFGLAKAFIADQGEEKPLDLPTLSAAATRQGVILGTAAYMSPEQARGKSIDKRADIWAFGCILYECLTGAKVFEGETTTETLAAVLKGDPNWDALPATTPQSIRFILRRCLQKDPARRLRDIGDLRLELEEILENPGDALRQTVVSVESRTKLRMILPWVMTAVMFTAIIAGVAVWRLNPPEPKGIIRYEYELPEGQQFSYLGYQVLAVSPDGRKLVYSTEKGLYSHSLDNLEAKLITGTEESVFNPFFSPDGKWIGYCSLTDGKLKKIATNGGFPLALSDSMHSKVSGASWAEDNAIFFSKGGPDITRISDDGEDPESIVKWKSGTLRYPQILPDGKSILYTYSHSTGRPKIMVQSLKSGESREITTGLDARYISTGHLIYLSPNNKNIFAVRFDLARLRVMSEPIAVIEGVNQFAVSESGTMVYIPETAAPAATGRTLVWVDREGKEEPLSADPMEYIGIRISPDGGRIALHVTSGRNNIYIWDMVRENMMRLTLDEGMDSFSPLWTPDGKRILFTSSADNMYFGDLYWKAADGTGKAEKLASSPDRGLAPYSWSKDGKTLLLWEVTRPDYGYNIGTFSMEGRHILRPLLQEKYAEFYPRVSPDGRWMAYMSNESGRVEVYVCPFPDVAKGGKWKVSTDGGNSPIWSPDGRELFYQNEDEVMAVPVETGEEFRPGKPTVLFRGTLGKLAGAARMTYTNLTYWDISPKDGRFLMLKDSGAEIPCKIIIIVNWFEELKRKVQGDH